MLTFRLHVVVKDTKKYSIEKELLSTEDYEELKQFWESEGNSPE